MPNYRSLIGGFYANPETSKANVSIRSNNPGAVNGAAWERVEPGYVKEIKYDGKNNTTIFETPEQGVAVYHKLLQKYADKGADTLGSIIRTYGGGQDYSNYVDYVAKATGLSPSAKINLNDDKVLLPFAKAMFRYEAGVPIPWTDAQIIYGFNLARGKAQSEKPTSEPPKPNKGWWVALWEALFGRAKPPAPSRPVTFADGVLAAMVARKDPVDKGDDVINIVYVEGVNTDGTPNQNRRNAFDDARIILRVGSDGIPKIIGIWESTIETGEFFTYNPIAEDGAGAARIIFGYQECWQVGLHRGYEALVQTGGPCSVARDKNMDFSRDGDLVTTGWYGINQHHGFNAPRDNIGRNSAGCLVGRMIKGHEEFMALVKSDKRYKNDHKFVFGTTVLKASEVLGK